MQTWRYAEVRQGRLVQEYYVKIDEHIFLVGIRNTGQVRQIAWTQVRRVFSQAVQVPWFKLPLPVKQKVVEIEEQHQIGIHNPNRPQIMQIK